MVIFILIVCEHVIALYFFTVCGSFSVPRGAVAGAEQNSLALRAMLQENSKSLFYSSVM